MTNMPSLRSLSALALAASVSLTLVAQPFDTLRAAPSHVEGQQPPQQPPPPQPKPQVSEVIVTAVGESGAPKLAVAGFIPLSSDAETIAAAKTISDVLWDDIAY